MEACIKMLTICLPNGMTSAVYGPTSRRQDDWTLFCLAQFDEVLIELCQEFHGDNTLYCTYGDGILAVYWTCV
jgi:isopentenyl phosphate kinase